MSQIQKVHKPVFISIGHELEARKQASRLKDQADFKAGVPGEEIARRNGCLPVEQVRKARIIFA
ncbi:MAG: hypothetical protein OQK94_09395 [Gammaproteobacteria bacterium]|nr:hypothetical protein [Gammaproteobacteria bacterium]MCW8840426.1 hypothetical protein [Gammaproteobacteria bacterium]MCW8957488.1 hypothetical protein [Gammaproteobacteria bacterium]MCW8991806.1 hypothetical protein [Gammaproteobacteria bacterium]